MNFMLQVFALEESTMGSLENGLGLEDIMVRALERYALRNLGTDGYDLGCVCSRFEWQ
jgi:hypothetical protein